MENSRKLPGRNNRNIIRCLEGNIVNRTFALRLLTEIKQSSSWEEKMCLLLREKTLRSQLFFI